MEAVGERDEGKLRALIHEDVRWWIPQSAMRRGLRRPLVGRDEVIWLLRGGSKSFQPGTTTWNFHHMVAEDDLVAAHMEREAIGANGRPYDNEYHLLFRFQDGLIVEAWEVIDSARAFEILGAEPVPQGPAAE
jgi:ketosteroid isomerase-like protein